MKRNRNHDQCGFTLIELLVVIAVLAVLFGVTAVSLTGVGSSADQEAAKAEADMVQTAIDVYLAMDSDHSVDASDHCEQTGSAPDGFQEYLRRQTRFCIGWDNNGNVLTASAITDCSDPLWTLD